MNMHLDTLIDDGLMRQAKQRSGLQTEREIIEAALQFWLNAQQAAPPAPDGEAALERFVACAHGDPLLSETYKERLSDSLRNKHGYR
jgi:hypothetical protein